MSNDHFEGSNMQPVGELRIHTPSSNVIETELSLCLESVSRSIQSLEQAQQITQECLQLEVCV